MTSPSVLSQSLSAAALRLQAADDARRHVAEGLPTTPVRILGSPIPGEISPGDAEGAGSILPDWSQPSALLFDRLIRAFCVAHDNENRTGAVK